MEIDFHGHRRPSRDGRLSSPGSNRQVLHRLDGLFVQSHAQTSSPREFWWGARRCQPRSTQSASALILCLASFFRKLGIRRDRSAAGSHSPFPGGKRRRPCPRPRPVLRLRPFPEPTPPPSPEPIPLPPPVPFDGMTAVDFGSPRFGMLFIGYLDIGRHHHRGLNRQLRI